MNKYNYEGTYLHDILRKNISTIVNNRIKKPLNESIIRNITNYKDEFSERNVCVKLN